MVDDVVVLLLRLCRLNITNDGEGDGWLLQFNATLHFVFWLIASSVPDVAAVVDCR